MANNNWLGGASRITELNTFSLALTWAAADDLTTTLTDENGTPTSVLTTVVGATRTAARDEHLADLQGEGSSSIFFNVTWASSGADDITGTAKDTGIPFHATVASTTAGDGTYAVVTTTANSGPNDAGTAANWSAGTVMASTEDVKVAEGSHDILYTLDQSAINLNSFRVSPAFRGTIGDNANGYYLKVDVSNGASPYTILKSGGGPVWMNGALDKVWVLAGKRADNMVRLDGVIDDLRISGPAVLGRVKVNAAADVDNVYVLNAPNAVVLLDENITSLDLIEMDSGNVTTESGASATLTVNSSGGKFIYHADADEGVLVINNRGADVEWNGSGTLATYEQFSGDFSTINSEAATTTIGSTKVEIHTGNYNDRSGLNNITYPTNILHHDANIRTEAGNTVDLIA